jgi:hypothetical protein
MLLVRGDNRVADIFFGEFMRVFAHHRFRESVKRHIEEFARLPSTPEIKTCSRIHKWVPDHFRAVRKGNQTALLHWVNSRRRKAQHDL